MKTNTEVLLPSVTSVGLKSAEDVIVTVLSPARHLKNTKNKNRSNPLLKFEQKKKTWNFSNQILLIPSFYNYTRYSLGELFVTLSFKIQNPQYHVPKELKTFKKIKRSVPFFGKENCFL